MRKIFEHFEPARVGHFQSILEQAGIATLIKNELTRSGSGEIPYTECYPELWVVNDSDYEKAVETLKPFYLDEVQELSNWTCPQCKEPLEGSFGQCWQCQTMRPESTSSEMS